MDSKLKFLMCSLKIVGKEIMTKVVSISIVMHIYQLPISRIQPYQSPIQNLFLFYQQTILKFQTTSGIK